MILNKGSTKDPSFELELDGSLDSHLELLWCMRSAREKLLEIGSHYHVKIVSIMSIKSQSHLVN